MTTLTDQHPERNLEFQSQGSQRGTELLGLCNDLLTCRRMSDFALCVEELEEFERTVCRALNSGSHVDLLDAALDFLMDASVAKLQKIEHEASILDRRSERILCDDPRDGEHETIERCNDVI